MFFLGSIERPQVGTEGWSFGRTKGLGPKPVNKVIGQALYKKS
jgi:hypothetical protein